MCWSWMRVPSGRMVIRAQKEPTGLDLVGFVSADPADRGLDARTQKQENVPPTVGQDSSIVSKEHLLHGLLGVICPGFTTGATSLLRQIRRRNQPYRKIQSHAAPERGPPSAEKSLLFQEAFASSQSHSVVPGRLQQQKSKTLSAQSSSSPQLIPVKRPLPIN
jgi:hypothetical protein